MESYTVRKKLSNHLRMNFFIFPLSKTFTISHFCSEVELGKLIKEAAMVQSMNSCAKKSPKYEVAKP